MILYKQTNFVIWWVGRLCTAEAKELLQFKEESWHSSSHCLLEARLSTCLRMLLQMLKKKKKKKIRKEEREERKGEEKQRKANKNWCILISLQIMFEMFILMFMTFTVLTLFSVLICVATISVHLSSVPIEWNLPLLPQMSYAFLPRCLFSWV